MESTRSIALNHNGHTYELVPRRKDELLEPYFLDALEFGTKLCRIEYRFNHWDTTASPATPVFDEHERTYPDAPELSERADPEATAEEFAKAFDEATAKLREVHPKGFQVIRVRVDDGKLVPCDACGEPILWQKTKRGKWQALDVRSAITTPRGTTMLYHYDPRLCGGSVSRKSQAATKPKSSGLQ